MIDHLLRFETRQAAEAVLGSPLPPNVILSHGGGNDESARVILQTDPLVLAEGWYCTVARPALDPVLRDLSGYACRLIADETIAKSGSPDFLLYVAPDIPSEVLATARVEPTRAGTRYPFGAG